MTERQKRFAEFYAGSGNAAEAARLAGYSEKTARSQGQRLLTDVDIMKYVRELQDKAAAGRIATMTQTKAFWSDIMHSTEEKTVNRLKASELLAKSAGAFLHLPPVANGEPAFVGEVDGEDVVIFVPQMLSEEECTAKEDEAQ